MHEELLEPAIHGALLVGYSGLAVTLAVASTIVEYNSYLSVAAGEGLLGGWMAIVGLLILVFAYYVLRDKALTEYRYLVQ